jgi:hypothetical protein
LGFVTLAGGLRSARALDARLDDEVGGTADHDQVFDIVAAHEHEASATVDGHGIDQRKAWHAPAANAAKTTRRVTPDEPVHDRDQAQDDNNRHQELDDHRSP